MSPQSILFENPYALSVILIVGEFVLFVVWSRRRTPRTGRAAIAGLFAIPVLLTVQAWIVTDAERVQQTCRAIANAIGDGDLNAMAAHFDDEFRAEERQQAYDKQAILESADRVLKEWSIQEERLAGFETTVDGDLATATFRSICRLVGDELTVPRHIANWELGLVRRGDAWRVLSVEQLHKTNASPATIVDFLR